MTQRRNFLKSLSYLLGGTIAAPALVEAQQTPTEPWLAGMKKGTHRFFMDVDDVVNGHPLSRVGNYIDAYESVYKTPASDLNMLFGTHGSAIAFVMNDAMWNKYKLGERNSVSDPKTGKPALRNVFLNAPAPGLHDNMAVSALMKRNVRFLCCHNAITGLANKLVADTHGNAADIVKDMEANLVPGTFIVPAMAVAADRAQEVGYTYAYVR